MAGPARAVPDSEGGLPGTARHESPREGRAWHVGLGILLSRVAGFSRDIFVAYFLGSSRYADLWYLGLRTPNVIQNLLGEGTLSSSFIPVYSRLIAAGRRSDAARLAGAALGLVGTVAFALALVGVLLAPAIVTGLFPRLGPDAAATLSVLLRILFPMTALFVVSAWALGILNSHGRHFISYAAPVVWNLAIIAAAVLAAATLPPGAGTGEARFVIWLAWGALAGGLAQVLVQLPFLWRFVRRVRPTLDARVEGLAEVRANFGPALIGRGVVNLSGLLDAFLAALLVQGAVAHLSRATALYLLPISIFAMAVSAAQLPNLARLLEADPGEFSRQLGGSLRTLSFVLLPTTVFYVIFGDLVVETVFERGGFTADDTRVVHLVLAAYSLGLLASGRSRLLVAAFFALSDTRAPARIATLRVGVSALVGAALMLPLDTIGVGAVRYGAAGLALGSAAGAWVEYVLLERRLARLLIRPAPTSRWTALGAAAACGVVVALGLRVAAEIPLRAALPSGVSGPVLAAGTALTFGGLYLAAARGLGIAMPGRSASS